MATDRWITRTNLIEITGCRARVQSMPEAADSVLLGKHPTSPLTKRWELTAGLIVVVSQTVDSLRQIDEGSSPRRSAGLRTFSFLETRLHIRFTEGVMIDG